MANFQTPAYEALGQDMSPDDFELTSFTSLESRAVDNHVDAPDQQETRTSSTEALHRPPESEEVELASQSPSLWLNDGAQGFISIPNESKDRSAMQRIGMCTAITLAATMVLMLAVFGFLTFLWTAPHENSFWRLIIVSGWAGGAVTVSSLVLRAVVDLQAGVSVAMLAGILLESDYGVSLVDTVQVSKLRAGRAMPLDITLPSLRGIQFKWKSNVSGNLRLAAVLLLFATTTLLQLTSTMLVSDLSLGILPGISSISNIDFDFAYKWNESGPRWQHPYQPRAVSAWLRNPPAFPTFAEFSKGIDVPEHVDDTGELMRAFLPFQDAQSRETIRQYSGKALVLDARVSCQRPDFQSLAVNTSGSFHITGTFSRTENVSRLFGPIEHVPFSCSAWTKPEGYGLSICQASGVHNGHGGRLLSDLRDAKQWSYGSGVGGPHLIIEVFLGGRELHAKPTSTTSAHGAWTDISYIHITNDTTTYVNLSVSLCYPAVWAARLEVEFQSPKRRTEPNAVSPDNRYRTDPDVYVQMGVIPGEDNEMTVASRGVLTLSWKDSWLPSPTDSVQFELIHVDDSHDYIPDLFITSSARMDTYENTNSNRQNASLKWTVSPEIITAEGVFPDFTIASIFTTGLELTNGSAAKALSTVITILSSMAYYDQFPNFSETAHDVTTAYFEPMLFPQSFRGFTAVLAITFAHCLLVIFILAVFVKSTHLTTLGDHWQSISQVVSPATESFLASSSCATDKEVRAYLKAEHRDHETANIQLLTNDGGRVGLVARKTRRRSSHDMILE